MRFTCALDRRLKAVAAAGLLNGIEYVEVRDTDEPVQALRQRTLLVRLLDPPPVDPVTSEVTGLAVVVDGGERIPSVGVEWVARADALPASLPPAQAAALVADLDEPDHVLVVRTQERGDFSVYRLRLVAGPGSTDAPTGFDPLLVEVGFSFKVECPGGFDCRHGCTCSVPSLTPPTIDYLAKDYPGFRRIMLERMALLAPTWTERNPADVGVTLVEALAYVADELSYRQDAVATEAYLETARSRVSLRRHARLVDYRVHEGCNARAWVRVRVGAPVVPLAAGTRLLTRVPGVDPRIGTTAPALEVALAARPEVFETVDDAVLHDDLDVLRFYTWGEQGCCLPAGTTRATLRGAHPDLRAGDVLVLAEVLSPTTLLEADADPAHRQAVRLVEVRTGMDPSGAVVPDGSPDVTEIRWHEDDALTFPLCLDVVDGGVEVARAWGNVVLADHGRTVAPEDLGTVPGPRLLTAPTGCDEPVAVPVRYRPRLTGRPLTHTVVRPVPPLYEVPLTPALLAPLDARTFTDPLPALFSAHAIAWSSSTPQVRGRDPRWSVGDEVQAFDLRAVAGMLQVRGIPGPAADATAPAPREALPALALTRTLAPVTDDWAPQADLLGSGPAARELTVETEHDGGVTLRFGDDVHGARPPTCSAFVARYRVGNGVAGNVGRDAIVHVVSDDSGVLEVTNPVPAAGGVDPEPAEQVRRDAPVAFAVQERAVTAADYAEVTERDRAVQRAAATFRWTGSWRTVFVTADRVGGGGVDAAFESGVRARLERYRMAGYDLEVDAPVLVPIELRLRVCVLPGYFRAHVAQDVRDALSDRELPGGRRGLFHPDALTFGQSVHVSSVHAAVHAVAGVQSVEVLRFRRQHEPDVSGLDSGVLTMGRLEIARLDDDPSFPERGTLTLTFAGGS